MKIKVQEKSYEDVLQLQPAQPALPVRQNAFFRRLLRTVSAPDLKQVGFEYTSEGMENLGPDRPCMFLMNHSSFVDLEMAAEILHDRQYHIICTDDGLVGKEWLMRRLGCIPTRKFLTDVSLVRNMKYCVDKLQSSILMYPEASYSFDGTQTPLPKSLGKCLKFLKVPVIMIKTDGAFLRDPLYNCLQKRQVKVTAHVYPLLTEAQLKEKSVEEINAILADAFTYDMFRAQHAAGIRVTEPFRADGMERAAYKCASCGKEHCMLGKGIELRCKECGKVYTLEENGTLTSPEGSEFTYLSDWYAWQRGCVRQELQEGSYAMEADVDIRMLVDSKAVYSVGEGHLSHTTDGFHLTGCDGKLDFRLPVQQSYSLYADYFWYELGDMICIGDSKARYYCFPKQDAGIDVAKARIAAEELFKMNA